MAEKFNLIYIDPPWDYGMSVPNHKGKEHFSNAANHYDCMKKDELFKFFEETIAPLADDPAVMAMWTTQAHLEQAIECGRRAGFNYSTILFNWMKTTSRDNVCRFMGPWTNGGSFELCLLFTKPGSKGLKTSTKVAQTFFKEQEYPQTFYSPRREHSRKPDEVYGFLEQLFANTNKLEVFARTARPGWTQMGDQMGQWVFTE